MDKYERLYHLPDISMILDNVNEVLNKVEKGMLRGCHGRYHTMFVVDTVEYLLKSLSYDSKTVELGKIAALLHDIGNIAGRKNHALKSAALAEVFLDNIEDLQPVEKDMIVQAIGDHTDGKNISSPIGAALVLADKVDVSKRRRLHFEHIDDWYSNLLQVENMDITVLGSNISINFTTTQTFDKEMFIGGYRKCFDLITKSAEYLGCTCNFRFNGMKE
ncbi:MAG: HD domain-containing protein [Clostridia bacterium]|nr:HD domain-containing protein [Clostridia bacterium]